MKEMMPIFYVGGSKGGVGKSMFSFALTDYLIAQGNKVFLMDTDTANPDIYKAHHAHTNENLECCLCNLDTADGWITLVNALEELPEHICVINAAARSNNGVQKHGAILSEALAELQRDWIAFWIINRQRDSVELLRIFLQNFQQKTVYVCRNLYFGAEDDFELYNSSKACELIEKSTSTMNFSNLADRVADKIYSERIPLWLAHQQLPIGDRAELRRWQNACKKMFQPIMQKEV